MFVFAASFLIFSGFAGFLSDRFSKRRIVVLAKVAEIVIMALGTIGFYFYSEIGFAGMLVILFLMGSQSAYFGPAKYGILPEMIRARDLPRANGIFLMLTFLAIIFGVIGVTRKFTKKGTSITGLILGGVSIIIAIIVTVILAAAASSVNESLNKEHKVEYVVTTTGPAQVNYWNGSGSSAEDITADWKKEFTAKGFEVTSLTVSGDFTSESSVTCEIFVDGSSVSKNSGTGTAATAACAGTSSLAK